MYRIGQEEIDEIAKVIYSRELFKINGAHQKSQKVEEMMKQMLDCSYAIFMTSGHAALVSALVAAGIGPGDQVIVPAYTYISTAMAVVAAGAIPVIAEVDETLTLSPEDVEKKITKNTKAIMPVHIQGFPCNMEKLCKIAKEHDLFVIEDACQADGGSFKGKRLGTIGDAGAFSFNFYKVISCGEGGALLTSNKKLYEASLIYHDSSAVAFFGDQMSGFEVTPFCGNEYRSNEINSALLEVQLTRLDGILSDLRSKKKYMTDALCDVCSFIPSNDITGDCGTTLPILFESEEKARKFLACDGICGVIPIDTGKHIYKHWTPIMEKRGAMHPLMDPFKMQANEGIIPEYAENMCPRTLELLSKVVYIPMNPDESDKETDDRIELIKKAMKSL